MTKIHTTFYILFIIFINSQFFGQPAKEETKAPKTSTMEKASSGYQNFAFVDAIKTYERIAAKGYKSVDLFQKLGNSYYYNAQLPEAARWYKELFEISKEVAAEYYYRYSMSLKSIGDYKKADEFMAIYFTKSGNDARGANFEKNKDYLAEIKKNSGRYKIKDAGINSKYTDFGTAFMGNKLVYASSRETDDAGAIKAKWTGQSYTNLFAADIAADGSIGLPTKLSKTLNSKFNESTPAFTRDGKTMYFTRNDFLDKKRGQDKSKTTNLKIYRAFLINNDWTNVEELPFNSSEYNVAHPALSPDDKTLYFASDMIGTQGLSDLFKVKILEDGTFGQIQNLGSKINTPGRETFPFISDKNELYFATDGHPGLGGLDVFVSKLDEKNSYSEPTNVGKPINDKTDDFAFIIDTNSNVGFFTSNRDGGNGFDDIYNFIEKRPLTCQQSLVGAVTEAATGDYLADAEVTLVDSAFQEIKKMYADEYGMYTFEVLCGQTYYIKAFKSGFDVAENKIVITTESGKTSDAIKLTKKSAPLKIGDNLAKFFNIKMIYFDLSKAVVRNDAALELEKILDVMLQNPKMVIDIRSHTDCRATAKFNEDLSSRRAAATVEWLVKNGVEPNRLTGKGYGESKLLNKCADGIVCTEEEHQANRRSEFIIISM
jgi:outer membrane protein OmpA-like peptidoglycan-associated protein